MNLNNFFKNATSLGIITLLIQACSGSNDKSNTDSLTVAHDTNRDTNSKGTVEIFAPTPYERIKILNSVFIHRGGNHRPLQSTDSIIIPASDINKVLDDNNAKYVLAIISRKGNNLNVDFIGSNSVGSYVSGSVPDDIKDRHKAFKRILHPIGGRPIGLDDFPTVIKKDTAGLERIHRETSCQSYIIYPCIEFGWPKGKISSGKKHDNHFTIGIMGSNLQNNNVNDKAQNRTWY